MIARAKTSLTKKRVIETSRWLRASRSLPTSLNLNPSLHPPLPGRADLEGHPIGRVRVTDARAHRGQSNCWPTAASGGFIHIVAARAPGDSRASRTITQHPFSQTKMARAIEPLSVCTPSTTPNRSRRYAARTLQQRTTRRGTRRHDAQRGGPSRPARPFDDTKEHRTLDHELQRVASTRGRQRKIVARRQ